MFQFMFSNRRRKSTIDRDVIHFSFLFFFISSSCIFDYQCQGVHYQDRGNCHLLYTTLDSAASQTQNLVEISFTTNQTSNLLLKGNFKHRSKGG